MSVETHDDVSINGAIVGAAAVHRRSAADWLTMVAVAVSVVVAAWTLFDPTILSGPKAMVGSARGTAAVVLFLAVPVVAIGVRLGAQGSPAGLFAWLGGLGYLLYNAIMFLFGTPMNALFLGDVAMLALTAWAIGLVVAQSRPRLAGRFPELPAHSIAVYMWIVVAINAAAWLAPILRDLVRGHPASMLNGTGLTTNPVYVQDLALWLPFAAVVALQLWRRRSGSYFFAGALLTMWVIESISVAVDQWAGHHADPTSDVVSLSIVPVFAGLAIIGIVPIVIMARYLRSPAPSEQ